MMTYQRRKNSLVFENMFRLSGLIATIFIPGLEIEIPSQSVFPSISTPSSSERVSRSAGDINFEILTQLPDRSQFLKNSGKNDTSNSTSSNNATPTTMNTMFPYPGVNVQGQASGVPLVAPPTYEGILPIATIPDGPIMFGTTITDNIQSAVAAATVERAPEPRCLEVVSECPDNVYYVAFADGGPQMYKGDQLELQGFYYWDALGWYKLDAANPRAQYCTLASQVALYIDISGDRLQSPRSEVFWSKESTNDTGRWCVHPTKLFHYRYFWSPSSGQGKETTEFFEDLDSGWRFEDCEQNQGVVREFYEYTVRGVPSYNQLRILRC